MSGLFEYASDEKSCLLLLDVLRRLRAQSSCDKTRHTTFYSALTTSPDSGRRIPIRRDRQNSMHDLSADENVCGPGGRVVAPDAMGYGYETSFHNLGRNWYGCVNYDRGSNLALLV